MPLLLDKRLLRARAAASVLEGHVPGLVRERVLQCLDVGLGLGRGVVARVLKALDPVVASAGR
eukprot:6101640-Pyramimonas_sp.AAC.2